MTDQLDRQLQFHALLAAWQRANYVADRTYTVALSDAANERDRARFDASFEFQNAITASGLQAEMAEWIEAEREMKGVK